MSGAAGSSKKATIYVGGFADEVNEQQLLETFVTFGMSPLAMYYLAWTDLQAIY